MKVSLLLLFVISSFGTLAQSSTAKGVLLVYEYFDRPYIDGFCYTYTASLANKTATSTLTVDYGGEIPKGGVAVAIYDTAGRLMPPSTFKQYEGKTIVDLNSSYKPGQYYIVVYRDDYRVLIRDKFLKQ
jgi:hypothetical protein